MELINSAMFTGTIAVSRSRYSPRVDLVICPTRRSSSSAVSTYLRAVSPSDWSLASRYRILVTISKGLLISWAIVAAMRPATASLSELRMASCASFACVMFRAIVEAAIMLPCASRTGEIVSETFSIRPSLVRRVVSKCSILPPCRRRVRICSTSLVRCGGRSIETLFPMTSSAR